MTAERKQEIINDLMEIYNSFEVDEENFVFEPEMFWLISQYNKTGKNVELIGGDWVIENAPSPLKDLPI